MNKSNQTVKNLLFTLFFFVVFFGGIELFLRFINLGFYYDYKSKDKLQFSFSIDHMAPHPNDADRCIYQLDPYCYYRLKPNFHLNAWNYYGRIRWEIHTNDLGFRSRPVSLEKRRSTFRIVCLGDSVTFGFNVDQEDTYASVLESILNYDFRERHFEVVNAAVPGHASPMGAELFSRYVLPLKPDLITIGFGRNDANAQVESPAKLLSRIKPYRRLLPILHSIETYKMLRYFVLGLRNTIYKPEPGVEKPADPKEFQENILKIVDIAQKNDIGVVLLNTDLMVSYQVDFLNKLAQEKGFVFVDFTRLLRGTLMNIMQGKVDYPELKFYRDVWGEEMIKEYSHLLLMWEGIHPNALGHWLMAQALGQAIQKDNYFRAYVADRYSTKHYDELPKPEDLTPP